MAKKKESKKLKRIRHNRCGRKRAYLKHSEAYTAMKLSLPRMSLEDQARMRVYRCKFCKSFHIGKK